MRLLRVALAFLRKDFLEDSSYRLNFFLALIFLAVRLVFLAFLSNFIGPAIAERTGMSGESYFDFVIFGVCAMAFLGTAVQVLTFKIRRAQTLGTLEALLAARAGIPTLVVCMPVYAFVQTTLRSSGYIILGSVFFGLRLDWAGVLPALAVGVMMLAAFGCLGLGLAALTIAFKRTEALGAVVSTLSLIFGGVAFPRTLWPEWVQDLSLGLPIAPALEGIRAALLDGGGWSAVGVPLFQLALFVAVVLPVAAMTMRVCLRKAMRDGTLTQY